MSIRTKIKVSDSVTLEVVLTDADVDDLPVEVWSDKGMHEVLSVYTDEGRLCVDIGKLLPERRWD